MGLGIRPGLLEEAVTVRVWTSSLAPVVMPDKLTVCSPEFSLIVRLLKAFKVGGAFNALTVSTNVAIALLVPSLTFTVIVALPD